MRKETVNYENANGQTVTETRGYLPCTIVSVASTQRTNSNDTVYRLAQVQYKLPNGQVNTCGSMLYENSLVAHPDAFKAGVDAEIEIQLDGEYKGRTKLQLPSLEAFDVDAFASVEIQEAV